MALFLDMMTAIGKVLERYEGTILTHRGHCQAISQPHGLPPGDPYTKVPQGLAVSVAWYIIDRCDQPPCPDRSRSIKG